MKEQPIYVDLRDAEEQTYAGITLDASRMKTVLQDVLSSLHTARKTLMTELTALCSDTETTLAMCVQYNTVESPYVIGAEQNKFSNLMDSVVAVNNRIYEFTRLAKVVDAGGPSTYYVLTLAQLRELGV